MSMPRRVENTDVLVAAEACGDDAHLATERKEKKKRRELSLRDSAEVRASRKKEGKQNE